MRVIAGEKKGFKLKAPKGMSTRPTEDRIKESLFNIIRNIQSKAVVLDLFAGSGGIGIEFLSRGAMKSYFVDNSYESIQCIKDNLIHTDLLDRAEIIKKSASSAIREFSDNNIKFNFIFADPPYGKGLALDILKAIDRMDILKEDGLLILEHEKDLMFEDESLLRLIRKDYRMYGFKALSFYTIRQV